MQLSDEDRAFLDEVRAFLDRHVTDELRRRDRETGENFDEAVHLAAGAQGYVAAELKPESEGGFSAVRRRIWELERCRTRMPWFHTGTTAMIARTVEPFASSAVRDEVLLGVYSGHIRLCLGFTEPDGGSDVARCKTRAVRDGDDWIVNGSKMFTSNAHNAQYVFLLTNTNPDAPKHQSLTMFLVPLDTPGIEIQGIRTVDGDRTNITYYSDVRVADKYRLGEVNGGWTVLRAALNAEHGLVERDAEGLQKIAAMAEFGVETAEAMDAVAAITARTDANGRRLIDDESVSYRLGRSIARMEAALSTPEMFGRVAVVQTMRDITPTLMDILGAAASLPVETAGAVDDGATEYLFRLSLPAGIYGGSLEVFRNMIAEHALELGRPNYSAAKR